MFTIGREREKEHAKQYIRDAAYYPAIDAVIDAVHDCLDGTDDPANVRSTFRHAFLESGSGAWEQTGSWMERLIKERPEFADMWEEFAESSKVGLRLRVAGFLHCMPHETAIRLLDRFSRDTSSKIRMKVAGDLWVQPRQGTTGILSDWLNREPDSAVQDEISLAIQKQKMTEQAAS